MGLDKQYVSADLNEDADTLAMGPPVTVIGLTEDI